MWKIKVRGTQKSTTLSVKIHDKMNSIQIRTQMNMKSDKNIEQKKKSNYNIDESC